MRLTLGREFVSRLGTLLSVQAARGSAFKRMLLPQVGSGAHYNSLSRALSPQTDSLWFPRGRSQVLAGTLIRSTTLATRIGMQECAFAAWHTTRAARIAGGRAVRGLLQ
jgi:hypothetical protein